MLLPANEIPESDFQLRDSSFYFRPFILVLRGMQMTPCLNPPGALSFLSPLHIIQIAANIVTTSCLKQIRMSCYLASLIIPSCNKFCLATLNKIIYRKNNDLHTTQPSEVLFVCHYPLFTFDLCSNGFCPHCVALPIMVQWYIVPPTVRISSCSSLRSSCEKISKNMLFI